MTAASPAGARPSRARGAPSDRHGLAGLFVGGCAIATAPIFVRVSEAGPIATGFFRLLFALPVLWAWMCAEGHAPGVRPPADRRDRRLLAFAGLCFGGDLAAWNWSIHLTSVANATLMANFAPIFVAVGGWALFGERFTPLFLAGMIAALAGATVLIADSVELGARNVLGDALGLLTAAFYGAYILSVGRLRGRLSTAQVMGWSGLYTCAVLLGLALLTGERMLPASLDGWLVLLGLAWISHGFGQSLIAYALRHLSAAFSAVGLLLQPAVAALLAWLWLDEALGARQAIGAGIVLAGIVAARLGSRRG
ncbi:MAG: DMT family transporter [Proteobacteria bacterium]|nr:DMT family transporter [Pseudomonadota bacterium]